MCLLYSCSGHNPVAASSMRTVQGDDEKFDHAFETGGLDVDDEDEVDQRERCWRIAMSLSAVLVDRSALPAASFIRRIIEPRARDAVGGSNCRRLVSSR